jgi:hypothetical protein
MRKLRNLLILAALALAVSAIPATMHNPDWTHQQHPASGTQGPTVITGHQDRHADPEGHQHEGEVTPHGSGSHDHTALADMHNFAFHFGAVEVHPETFGSVEGWFGDWDLRWVEYGTADGHMLLVYHITNRHNDAVRYTVVGKFSGAHESGWEPVH